MTNLRNKLLIKNGFTLIELLVAITIIGLLATVATFSAAKALERNRDNRRKADLSQLANALDNYYYANRVYPSSEKNVVGLPDHNFRWLLDFKLSGLAATSCFCETYSPYISNLTPTYINKLPRDPKFNLSNSFNKGYMYRSDGQNFKVVAKNSFESLTQISSIDDYYDPKHPQSLQVSSPNGYQWWLYDMP